MSIPIAAATEELAPGQRAEPNECGSCKFFRRVEYDDGNGGECQFRLPDKITRSTHYVEYKINEEGYPIRQRDTDGCDFWKAKEFGGKPVQFHQKRYWYAGASSS